MTVAYRYYRPWRKNIVSATFPAALQRGFNFQAGQKNTLACTATPASVQFIGPGTDFEFKNVGTGEAFVAFGGANVTVTSGGTVSAANDGGLSIPAGAILIYNAADAMTAQQGAGIYVAGVCASSVTTTLRITQGSGS